jgi:hypothetical protein
VKQNTTSYRSEARTTQMHCGLRLPTDEEAARRLGRRVQAPHSDPDPDARPHVSLGVLRQSPAALVPSQAPREAASHAAV